MTIQKTIVALIFLYLSGYVMANKIEKFEQLSINDIVDYKIERMIHSLDLTETQRIKIEAILQSSSNQIKKNKSELIKIKKQYMEMEPSDLEYKKKIEELSNEIGSLTSEQLILKSSIKKEIYNELQDDQKEKIRSGSIRNNRDKTKRGFRKKMKQFFRKNNQI